MALGNSPRAEEMIGRRHAATGSVAEGPSRITSLVPVPNIIYHILSISSSLILEDCLWNTFRPRSDGATKSPLKAPLTGVECKGHGPPGVFLSTN